MSAGRAATAGAIFSNSSAEVTAPSHAFLNAITAFSESRDITGLLPRQYIEPGASINAPMQTRVAPVFLSGLIALSALATAPIHGQALTGQSLVVSLQQRYATIRDFRADFTHTVQGAVLRTVRTTERGELKVMKPGRVFMSYGPPQKKSFVTDGVTVQTYIQSDRTGTVGPMPQGDDLSVAILLLAGRGDLVKDFEASMPPLQPTGEWQMDLVPKQRQEDFATLTLFVDRQSLAFRGLTTSDHLGGSFVFRFTNLRENTGLKDTDFRFTFPRGTHVIETGRGK